MRSAIITRSHETQITDYKITTMVSHTDLINQNMEITDYEITPVLFTEENLIQKLNEMSVERRASVIRVLNRPTCCLKYARCFEWIALQLRTDQRLLNNLPTEEPLSWGLEHPRQCRSPLRTLSSFWVSSFLQ